jgi:hypothetical protein
LSGGFITKVGREDIFSLIGMNVYTKLVMIMELTALEDMDAEVETIRENIKISAKEILGYFELRKNKP